MDPFESMLSGGHPSSLGRAVDVVDAVLADRSRLAVLYQCWFSDDEVVRLRVSGAMKRVTIAQPSWTMDFMDGLQSDVAAIDQASTQWTLALLFDLIVDLLSQQQWARAVEIMEDNVAHHSDWIVLSNSMKVLRKWAADDAQLAAWLRPHLHRLADDKRRTVARNACKVLDDLGEP